MEAVIALGSLPATGINLVMATEQTRITYLSHDLVRFG